MKIIVAVIIYDRYQNLLEWCRCWLQCNISGAELIIIHNFKNNVERRQYHTYCVRHKVRYIPRQNVGMDIGALQDVFRGRLIGFPNQWDRLLWIADDTYPMSKDFVQKFIEKMPPEGGVSCLEVSREVKTHIRTTGFMIDQGTASNIQFPVNIVRSKGHCYEFEHRSPNAFYEQVINMGKQVVQVNEDLKQSCLWDTHSRGKFHRMEEHYQIFPK